MGLIKNIHLLTGIGEKEISMMEHAALEHSRHSSITFKIVEYTDSKVIMQVAQGKNAIRAYHDKKRLIEIVNETFGRFFEGKKLIANAISYNQPPVEVVTPSWIENNMKKMGIDLDDIIADTGMSKPQLSAAKTGGRNLSQQAKAFFYYYFQSKRKTG